MKAGTAAEMTAGKALQHLKEDRRHVEDEEIIRKFNSRDEDAIRWTAGKALQHLKEDRQHVEDEEIIRKFNSRDEDAIRCCERQYGRYLKKIALNILSDSEEAEEVLNDSLLQAWNSIPPEKPGNLPAYLTAVTRANAIDLFRKKNALKRRSLFEAEPISELSDIVSDSNTEEIVDRKLLSERISRFLKGESRDARVCFVLRYYYMDSVPDIRRATGFSAAKIKTLLFRTRNKLREVLEKEGYTL